MRPQCFGGVAILDSKGKRIGDCPDNLACPSEADCISALRSDLIYIPLQAVHLAFNKVYGQKKVHSWTAKIKNKKTSIDNK